MRESIEKISYLMAKKYLIDISMYNDSFLETTVRNRIVDSSVKNISDYISYLENNPSESIILNDSLNNSFSEFFRNPLTSLLFEKIVFPKIFSRKIENKSGEIRIWSAGCASGQEPYSLAIMAEDYKTANQLNINIRIFATDKNVKELQSAFKGIYHQRSLQNARLSHVNKYFSNSGEFYSINPEVKKLVDFSVFDLLDNGGGAPPSSIYGDFDIIMCSNLLFYYKPSIQKKILAGISKSLVSGGYLITGEAEVEIIKTLKGFKHYSSMAAIFVKT